MSVVTREVVSILGGTACSGLLAYDPDRPGPRPGVLVAHTIRGRTAFEQNKAHLLAEQGYAALAIDLFGTASRNAGQHRLREHMRDYLADRECLRARIAEWHALLCDQGEVNDRQTAAIGFCFGGLCALDLARSGADVTGVVSFHGLLTPPRVASADAISAKILVLHGWDDPLAPPDDVRALATELTERDADWQIHAYGNTVHAFTNPIADDSAAGTVYNAAADRRSQIAMQVFLSELFST